MMRDHVRHFLLALSFAIELVTSFAHAEDRPQESILQAKLTTEREILNRLSTIIDNKAAPQLDRLTALYILASNYAELMHPVSHDPFGLMMRFVDDRFAMQRKADALFQRYAREAQPLFPQVPPLIRVPLPLPSSLASFDRELAKARQQLTTFSFGERCNQDPVPCYVLHMRNHSDAGGQWGQRLYLDAHGELAQQESLSRLLKRSEKRFFADKYQLLMELDRSLALYQQASAEAKADDQSEINKAIALNRRLNALAVASPLHKYQRELLQGNPSYRAITDAEKLFTGDKLRPAALYALAKSRQDPTNGFLIGDRPVWILQQNPLSLMTGARSEPRRADELRYYLGELGTEPKENLTVIGGTEQRDIVASFGVSFVPAADFWPPEIEPGYYESLADAPLQSGRPEVGFLFGLRDINCAPQPDGKDSTQVRKPMHGFMLALREKSVDLVELIESERIYVDNSIDKTTNGYLPETREYKLQSRESQAAPLAQSRELTISIQLAKDTLRAEINGQRYTFNAPTEHTGFYGLRFRGQGYAAIRALKINSGPAQGQEN